MCQGGVNSVLFKFEQYVFVSEHFRGWLLYGKLVNGLKLNLERQ